MAHKAKMHEQLGWNIVSTILINSGKKKYAIKFLDNSGSIDIFYTDSDWLDYFGKQKEPGKILTIKALIVMNKPHMIENILMNFPDFNLKSSEIIFMKMAAHEAHVEIFELLVRYGFDITIENNYAIKTVVSRSNYYSVIFKDDYSFCKTTPSHRYPKDKIANCAKFLIDCGADVSADGNHPIIFAADSTNFDIVRLLALHGANIHADDEYCLNMATSYGLYDDVVFLLESGADPNGSNGIALKNAISSCDYDIAKLLLDYGAHINFLDTNDIVNAITSYTKDLVQLLLDHGVDFTKANSNKKINKGDMEFAQILIDAGVHPAALLVAHDKYK